MSNGKNKEEFLRFLLQAKRTTDSLLLKGVDIFITHEQEYYRLTGLANDMTCTKVEELTCDREEADTRMVRTLQKIVPKKLI